MAWSGTGLSLRSVVNDDDMMVMTATQGRSTCLLCRSRLMNSGRPSEFEPIMASHHKGRVLEHSLARVLAWPFLNFTLLCDPNSTAPTREYRTDFCRADTSEPSKSKIRSMLPFIERGCCAETLEKATAAALAVLVLVTEVERKARTKNASMAPPANKRRRKADTTPAPSPKQQTRKKPPPASKR